MPETSWIRRNREVVAAVAVTLLVFALRVQAGRHLTFCGTPDSCFYLGLGQSLAQHRGFHVHFLYQYQFVQHVLPSSGIDYWRPGTSLLLLLAQPFGGVSLHSGMVLATLAGIFLALAAWKTAMAYSNDRRIACCAYLICLVLPPLWDGSQMPDSPLFYGAFVAWFLALFTVRAPRRASRYLCDILALGCVAFVNLIRNDTVLLLAPLLVVLWLRRRKGTVPGASPAYAALMVAGFFAATLPLDLLDHAVLGKFFVGGGASALYLTGLSDLTIYGAPLNLHTMLAAGAGKLLKLRLVTLPMIVYRVLFGTIGFATVFVSTLFFARSPESAEANDALPESASAVSLAVALLLVYGLVLPAIGQFSALRTSIGLLPWFSVLVAAGVYRAMPPARASLLLSGVVVFYLVSGFMEDGHSVTDKNSLGDRDRRVAAYLLAHGVDTRPGNVIMTPDGAQFSVTTGYWTVPMPSNGIQAAAQAARDLGATNVLVDNDPWPYAEIQAVFKPQRIDWVPGTSVQVVTLSPPKP
jgi:hypothetical protein